MAWTAPATWTTGEVVTAAKMNTHVRDNLLETAPAKGTIAGDMVYASAANTIARLPFTGQSILTGNATTGLPAWRSPSGFIGDASYSGWGETSYTDFNLFSVGAGTNVTVAGVTTGTAAIVVFGASYTANTAAGGITVLNYRVSGATTVAADTTRNTQHESGASGDRGGLLAVHFHTGLTAGNNTFTLQAFVTTGLGTVSNPHIGVIPL